MEKDFAARMMECARRVPAPYHEGSTDDALALHAAGIDSLETLRAFVRQQDAPPQLRDAACWFLARLDPGENVPVLLDLARDASEEPGLRESALIALSVIGDPCVVESLIEMLHHDPLLEMQIRVAYTLGWTERNSGRILDLGEAAQALVQILADSQAPDDLREQAAESLGLMGATAAIPSLLRALDDPAAVVRFSAVYALGSLRAGRALKKIKRMARTDTAYVKGWWTVQREAREMLPLFRRQPAERVTRKWSRRRRSRLTRPGGK